MYANFHLCQVFRLIICVLFLSLSFALHAPPISRPLVLFNFLVATDTGNDDVQRGVMGLRICVQRQRTKSLVVLSSCSVRNPRSSVSNSSTKMKFPEFVVGPLPSARDVLMFQPICLGIVKRLNLSSRTVFKFDANFMFNALNLGNLS